ncbi:MAG: glycogen synthase [Candidatus Calescibacterium sp.]|nr:glycogen synthase [Candidatus Calescibacterium sp.]MCX7733871.1 glycogen synthase [bacterium]MDW8086652.1 glycogen/starch synthase [Candidatus Calescibacterium sp.]
MKIAIVSSEMYPYAKTGGLGDYVFTLVNQLKNKGVECYGIIPFYKHIKEKYVLGKNFEGDSGLEISDEKIEGIEIKDTGKKLKVEMNGRAFEFSIYQGNNCIFFENEELFGRDFIYGPPGGSYDDNHIRFGAFCWAVAKSLKEKIIDFDIIHTNDWITSLVPLISKEIFRIDKKFAFTIHNFAYQGLYPKNVMQELGLPSYLFNMEALEFWGLVNIIKAGIVFSDQIFVVSPTYAEEIKTYDYGYGLEGLIRKYEWKIKGILNGIDYKVWDPTNDKEIPQTYSEKTLAKRSKNKTKLAKEYGFDAKKPLFCVISRLTHQKGMHFFTEYHKEVFSLKANFLFLGMGEYQHKISSLSSIYDNVKVETRFRETLARKFYAAADFILVPSLFEPCGISQIIGMRYGCIPVVRKTGGLADTVKDIQEEDGYGIVFENPTKQEFLCALKRAVELYDNKAKLKKLTSKVMKLDFSAERMVQEYLKVYEKMI